MANSAAGVTSRVINRTFGTPNVGGSICGMVVNSDRGPTELTEVTNIQKFLHQYGEPAKTDTSKHAVLYLLREASRVKVKRIVVDAAASSVVISEDVGGVVEDLFTVNAENPGAWGNNISVSFSEGPTDSEIWRILVDYNGKRVESFEVSHREGKKDGFGSSLYMEDVVNGNSDYITITDNTSFYEKPDEHITGGTVESLAGGSDDTTAPTASDIVMALDSFSNKSEVDVNFLVNGGFTQTSVQQKFIDLASGREDCFAFLDIPASVTDVAGATTHVDPAGSELTQNTSFAAVYYSWITNFDPYTSKTVDIAPSVAAATAAVVSRAQAEIWSAPAGLRRGRVRAQGVKQVFTEGEMQTLYENNINPIQQFANEGIVVWGQKTLTRQASALDRINVRLLVNYVQETLDRALKPFVFQPNTAFERENITSMVEGFLEDIKNRRGVYDYAVVCDESNNTPVVIDRNELIVDVFIKPTRTAEFIKLNTILTPTGVDIS